MIDLIQGHALTEMRAMPDGLVECIVTSPPYWGLRSYGTEPQVWPNGAEPCAEHQWGEQHGSGWRKNEMAGPLQHPWNSDRSNRKSDVCSICGAWRGELGLEPTPELYVEHLVQIFREARRVLRDDGTLWLNLGDSYSGAGSQGNQAGNLVPSGFQQKSSAAKSGALSQFNPKRGIAVGSSSKPVTHTGLKPKDLIGIPWRVAFALQADGWYLRSDIIWSKPNPMPESVTDRPTKAHEYIFLLSKSEHYFYDADAIREQNCDATIERSKYRRSGFAKQDTSDKTQVSYINPNTDAATNERILSGVGRNRRTVWTVATHAFADAHFATFPPKLIEPCILAGTSAKGVCPECGAPWERVTERESWAQGRPSNNGNKDRNVMEVGGGALWSKGTVGVSSQTLGWRPTCSHNAEPIPATVLDPFGGSGTTGKVAVSLGRKAILIDLKPEYLEMAEDRTSGVQVQLMPGM